MPARRMTKSTVDALADAVEGGLPEKTACAIAGVAAETTRLWRRKGREALARIEAGMKGRPGDRPYVKFLRRMESARARGIEVRLKQVQDAGDDGDWRASWRLLTRYAEFKDSPPSGIGETLAVLLAATVEGRDGMTPTTFLTVMEGARPETEHDFRAWVELYEAGLRLAKAELDLKRERGEMLPRRELDEYIALIQAAWGQATGAWFDRDLEDFRSLAMDRDTLKARIDDRINTTLAGQPTPGSARPEGEASDGRQGTD